MISPCPPYYSSALSCLLCSHHVLLFRLVASDCLSCSAKLGRSVLSSSLALSFSMPLASCLHLLSCYSAHILSALLCHEAASIWYWEARLRLSHQGTQTNLCVLCVGVQRRERLLKTCNNRVSLFAEHVATCNCNMLHDGWSKLNLNFTRSRESFASARSPKIDFGDKKFPLEVANQVARYF